MSTTPHPCKGCGRTTVSTDDYCAMCHNGYVPARLVGIKQWRNGVLVDVTNDTPKSPRSDV